MLKTLRCDKYVFFKRVSDKYNQNESSFMQLRKLTISRVYENPRDKTKTRRKEENQCWNEINCKKNLYSGGWNETVSKKNTTELM